MRVRGPEVRYRVFRRGKRIAEELPASGKLLIEFWQALRVCNRLIEAGALVVLGKKLNVAAHCGISDSRSKFFRSL